MAKAGWGRGNFSNWLWLRAEKGERRWRWWGWGRLVTKEERGSLEVKGCFKQRLGWTCSAEKHRWREEGRRAPVLMVQTQLHIPQLHRSSSISTGKEPCPPSAPYSKSKLASSPQCQRQDAVGCCQVHSYSLPMCLCRGGTWENPGCLLIYLKIKCKSCFKEAQSWLQQSLKFQSHTIFSRFFPDSGIACFTHLIYPVSWIYPNGLVCYLHLL